MPLHRVDDRYWEYYDREKNLVRCRVCERGCVLRDGFTGFCWNYMNIGGVLYDVGYGLLSAVEPRPIEIKPLFHYYPGSWALTFSGWGCNYRCPWCQNYHLSMNKPNPSVSIEIPPEQIVSEALRNDQQGVCGSFNEPSIHLQYLIQVGLEARKHGLYASLVTNGYMSLNALNDLLEAGYTGFSIDIKGCVETYRKYLGADPLIVYRNAKTILEKGGHVEMVYLVIPGVNDWEDCYRWVVENHLKYLGADIPLHINKYYPAYKFDKPPTPFNKLLEIHAFTKKIGLEYVYIGNVYEETYQDTRCPRCGRVLIVRRGYRVIEYKLVDGKCPYCGYEIRIYGKPVIG